MSTPIEQLIDLGFELFKQGKYASVLRNKAKGQIACVMEAEYVPISEFRQIFGEMAGEVKLSGGYTRFIFDKRALRTFHQPSMEWYFVHWKTEMYTLGLRQHRKLLPDLPWFVKSVEIARKPLVEKLPAQVRSRLDIIYCNSLEEAVQGV